MLNTDAFRPRAPTYSVGVRRPVRMTFMDNPGPGHYPVPSTTGASHPTIENMPVTRFAVGDRFNYKDPEDY